MNQRHYLLKGTFILTFTGLVTRAAGFFYKIFLSRTIGAAQIGLFQLTLPLCAFCMALSCGGVQTAVSRFTAESYAEKNGRAALRILACALLLSGGLSAICSAALFLGAPWIARSFLLQPACALLLQMTALSLPFAAIHGCIGGFFIGRKNVAVSAAAQLVEQLLRIAAVFFFFSLAGKSGRKMDASAMALGQIAGELAAALFCVLRLSCGKNAPIHDVGKSGLLHPRLQKPTGRRHSPSPFCTDLARVLSVSTPLCLNRMLVCILQGIEAALLPQMLCRFGHDSSRSLAAYGTLSGMALPLIMFPTAVTAALGTLLLPAVSEARALRQDKKIAGATNASFQGSLLLGLFFLGAFLLFGGSIGELLFHSELAGIYTRKLALLCPFLYVNTTLVSILHGLGATTLVTVWNIAGFGVRLAAVLLLVPKIGIDGYFAGTLLSQALLTICTLFTLRQRGGFCFDLANAFAKPGLICILSGAGALLLKNALPYLGRTSWASLACLAFIFSVIFSVLAFLFLPDKNVRRRLLSRSQ